MAHTTEWYLENRIILTEFSETLTIEGLVANDSVILDMVQGGQAPVHLVIDVRQLDEFPTNISKIRNSARRYLMLDNMGWMVVVGFDNPIIRFLSSVITQMTDINMIQVDDLDEAMARLQKVDLTLQE